MNRHAHRQMALKARQYRQSQRVQSTATFMRLSRRVRYKRLLWSLLLVVCVGALALGAFAILHTSPNAATSPNTARTAQSGLTDLSLTRTPATPQVSTGVFAPGEGGPIPVPANVLKPTNSARTVLNSDIYSIYAGALIRQPEIGVLAVLQENEVSGQQSLHLYQSPRPLGSLTILSLQGSSVSWRAANGSLGTFDLLTDQFHFS